MKKVLALTNYKGHYGSKHFDKPYRSGMDKELLIKEFAEKEYELEFKKFHAIDFKDKEKYKNKNIIYTSSEDTGYHYKSYIEDVVFALEILGANIIPSYKYLRANNNKVFMEKLRSFLLDNKNLQSHCLGTLQELFEIVDQIDFPCVLKGAAGASGKSVFLAKNKAELIKKIKKLKPYSYFKEDIKDNLRHFKHHGYIKEDPYRFKYIIQNFIPNLKNDWKIYVFGSKMYIFMRPILSGRGIKASGGGYDNYFYGKNALAPEGIFDFAYEIFNKLDVPHLSLDIAFDGNQFYLIEFQAIYFGTAGIPYSNGYFVNKEGKWNFCADKLPIETVYANSIIEYLNK